MPKLLIIYVIRLHIYEILYDAYLYKLCITLLKVMYLYQSILIQNYSIPYKFDSNMKC